MTLSGVHKVKIIFILRGDLPFSFLFSHEWTGRISRGSLRADHMQRSDENAAFRAARRERGVKTGSNASLLRFFCCFVLESILQKNGLFSVI